MKLHIGNLPRTMTDPELKELVAPFGATTSLDIIKDSNGGSRGYGFAEFANDDHARAAITGLNGKVVSGQTLTVAEARPRKADLRK